MDYHISYWEYYNTTGSSFNHYITDSKELLQLIDVFHVFFFLVHFGPFLVQFKPDFPNWTKSRVDQNGP